MTDIPQEHLILLAQIDRVAKEIEHGNIILDVKVHNGTPASTIATYAQSKKYKRENTTALAEVIASVKSGIDNRVAGSKTFTIEYDGTGNIDRIVFDKNDKKRLV